MAALGIGASYVLAAKAAGYTFSSLVNGILDVAHARYFGTGISQAEQPSNRERIYYAAG
jgi:D-alanine-D-alanine ligase